MRISFQNRNSPLFNKIIKQTASSIHNVIQSKNRLFKQKTAGIFSLLRQHRCFDQA